MCDTMLQIVSMRDDRIIMSRWCLGHDSIWTGLLTRGNLWWPAFKKRGFFDDDNKVTSEEFSGWKRVGDIRFVIAGGTFANGSGIGHSDYGSWLHR